MAPVQQVKACFICNSTEHLASFHKNKYQARGISGNPKNDVVQKSGYKPRVNRCATVNGVLPAVELEAPDRTLGGRTELSSSVENQTGDERNTVAKQCATCSITVSEGALNDVTPEGISTCVGQGGQDAMQVACTDLAVDNSEPVVFSKLKYLDVQLLGDERVFRATYDTGTEVSVIRSSLLESGNISYVDVGDVCLRPMAGPNVPAKLIRVRAKLVCESQNADDCKYSDVIVGACEGLHDKMILAGPVAFM